MILFLVEFFSVSGFLAPSLFDSLWSINNTVRQSESTNFLGALLSFALASSLWISAGPPDHGSNPKESLFQVGLQAHVPSSLFPRAVKVAGQ
jgi:hypothetical protein